MKYGVVLSGGGVLGASHIGFFEQLEKTGIKPKIVCGTSAGAIAGLLYADGGVEALRSFFEKLEHSKLFSAKNLILSRHPNNVFAKIESILRECVKAESFDDLKCKYACVATDIVNGSKVVLTEGDPVSAVMASAAYPGVFPMQRVNGLSLVDGGLTSNFPASIAKQMGADVIIGSVLYYLPEIDPTIAEKLPRMAMLRRSLEILELELTKREMIVCDFCFSPNLFPYKWYNFDKIAQVTERGREEARKKMKNLKENIKISRRKRSFWLRNFEALSHIFE